jgi:hypothetical protein
MLIDLSINIFYHARGDRLNPTVNKEGQGIACLASLLRLFSAKSDA